MDRSVRDDERGLKEAGVCARDFSPFWDMVQEFGGDRHALLRELAVDPSAYGNPDEIIPFRLTAKLFEIVAMRLNRPSFGLDLGAKAESLAMFGPLRVAMHNAGSLKQACEFYEEFIRSYCPPFDSIIHYDEMANLASVGIDLVSHTPANSVQGAENWLMLLYRLIRSITADKIRPREIWFRHERVSSVEVYRRHFDETVLFGMPTNAIRFARADFERPHAGSNRQLFELATYFVRHEYRPCVTTLVARVCDIIRETLTSGECSSADAADRLGLLPRTLQRRLQDEGASFEVIKDNVRRKLALQYLGQSQSMTEVAAQLGYSEPSVLTRSCHRWFAASPRDIRTQLRRAGELSRSDVC